MNSVFVPVISFVTSFLVLTGGTVKGNSGSSSPGEIRQKVILLLKDRVIGKAEQFLKEKPVTVTASSCKRSAGGPHDFFSEGPYWWPDTSHPDGPLKFRTGDGKGLSLGLEYMLPYIKEISKWPHPKDVSDWDSQPGQRNFMVFAAIANNDENWLNLWESLGRKRTGESLRDERNHLLLWLDLKDPRK